MINHSWCSLQTLNTTWRYLYISESFTVYFAVMILRADQKHGTETGSRDPLLIHYQPYTMPLLPRKSLKIDIKRCMIFQNHRWLFGKSILQVPDTGTRVLANTRPFLHSSIVSFWITPACSKGRKYHIFRQYWYTRNVPVFTNTGMFQYLGPGVYFFRLFLCCSLLEINIFSK